MKNALRFFIAILPTLVNAASLLPNQHADCLSANATILENRCDEGSEFYIDHNGKCGCLPQAEITAPEHCTTEASVCGGSLDRAYSSLYQYRLNQGLVEIVFAGCGCYLGETNKAKPFLPARELKSEVSVPCSTPALASAINNANAAGSGTLRLAPSCTYSIQTPATANEGLPPITGNVTIIGGPKTTIERDLLAPAFRIFTVNNGATLTLTGITIKNGESAGLGGGIFNSGALSIDLSTFSNNRGSNGGGISVAANAMTTISRSLFIANTTGSVGGGAFINFGNISVAKTRFKANTAPINGGAINTQPGGITNVDTSDFSENTSGSLGGAIANLGSTFLLNSLIDANTGSGGGGIATANSNVSLTTTKVLRNSPDNCSPLNTITGCVN